MSDHKYFNCSEDHEHEHVVRQYDKDHRASVRDFLKEKCGDKTIKYSSHDEVYSLIHNELGLKKQ